MKKVIFIFISLIIILAGCGKQDSDKESDLKAFKQDDNTEIKIPKNPKRIVVLHPTYIGAFVKFRHTPVGVTNYVNQNKTLKEATKSSKVMNANDIEAITKLKPDFIITTKEDKNYKKIEKISPTIQIDAMKSNYKETTKKWHLLSMRTRKLKSGLKNGKERLKLTALN
ncbi:hypothetical protein N9R04_09975 [Staphylococcus sp. SQ8-PEA]|uniref:Fe/B12 periplasmic-binding domain-containing protein n=1 Tax=Staphylococcus marylandisciuri TaxID=2981529 RepID=A0ABT2QSN0_9STAP|nr:hypothetical protein [Staphylococcus marylandisciuri]MCU5747003.1 hypothetical protein [Staphylococcus marylandisciuri]